MAERFDPEHADKLENPDRLVELPPASLVKLLRLNGAETVIDFGAGSGMYSFPIAEALPRGRLLAVETQPESLERLRAKRAARPAGARVEAVLSAPDRVPLPDDIADRMLIVNVLHHVHDQPDTLTEIRRLLAPGGLLAVAEFARMDRPVGPPNERVLTLDEVRALITALGLRELSLHGPGEIGRYHYVIVAQKPGP